MKGHRLVVKVNEIFKGRGNRYYNMEPFLYYLLCLLFVFLIYSAIYKYNLFIFSFKEKERYHFILLIQ